MSTIKSLSLRKNFSWNFIANVIYAITQWIIIASIAKIGTAQMVGQFSLGLALTAPIILFTNLQLRVIQATDSSGSYQFKDYLSLRTITNIVAIVIFLLVIFWGNYGLETGIIIFLVGISKIIDSISDIIYGYLQQKERMDYPSKSKIIRGILSVLFLVVVLFFTENLMLSLVTYCTAFIIVLFFYDIQILKKYTEIKVSFNKKVLKELIILSFPLGLTIMLSSLYTNIPRILVEKYVGLELLGYFSAIAYILVAGNTFINAIGQAISPRLAKLYAGRDLYGFKRILGKSIFVSLIIGALGFIIIFFIGDIILELIYDSSYAHYHSLLIIMTISTVINFVNSFLGTSITSTRNFKIQTYLAAIWIIFTLISSLILIPKFNIYGAAYSLIITSSIQFISLLLTLIFILKK